VPIKSQRTLKKYARFRNKEQLIQISDSRTSSFASANANNLSQMSDKDFSITYLSRSSGGHDLSDDRLRFIITNDYFYFYLR
jgi:hypothetical protein